MIFSLADWQISHHHFHRARGVDVAVEASVLLREPFKMESPYLIMVNNG